MPLRESLADDFVALRGIVRRPLARATLAAHFATVFGIALSNGLLALAVLFTVPRAVRAVAARVRRPEHQSAAASGDRGPIRARGVFWVWAALGLYGLAFLLSTLLSRVPDLSWQEFFSEILTLLALPLAAVWLSCERALRVTTRLLGLMVVVVAIYGILQFLFSDYGPLGSRIPGPFSHYMTFSGVLLIGDLLFLTRLLRAPRTPWLWTALVLIHAALGLTLTRHAWIGAFVAASVVIAIRWRKTLPWFVVIVIVGLAGASVFVPRLGERLTSIVDLRNGSNYDRLCMIWSGLHMIEERPLFGSGPHSVARLYPIYRHPTAPSSQTQHLHNTFLQLAAERGLVSLFAYLGLMSTVLLVTWRRYRREGGWRGPRGDLLLFSLLVVVIFNLAGLFEANWRDTEVARVVLLALAIPVCLERESMAGVGQQPR